MENKDFTLHLESLDLQKLGFKERCLAYYNIDPSLKNPTFNLFKPFDHKWCLPAPTYSEAFRWFREEHNYHVIIDFNQSKNNKWYYGIIQIDHNISVSPDVEFETYEEAELAALKELIKTIKDRT